CVVWIQRTDTENVVVSQESSPDHKTSLSDKSSQQANRPPTVNDRKLTTPAGTEVYVQLSFEDEDGPGPYVYDIVQGPKHGTLSGDNNDRYYTPKAGFTGTDQFRWKVHDGEAASKIATVAITVTAPGD